LQRINEYIKGFSHNASRSQALRNICQEGSNPPCHFQTFECQLW
jgi:hypothetical protein